MKHLCPHCQKNTIGSWEKMNSTGLHPAECPECKGICMLSHEGGEWASLTGIFGFPIMAIISMVAKSWLPISFFALGLIAYVVYRFISVPMVPASLEVAKRQHWWALIGLLIVLTWLVYEAL